LPRGPPGQGYDPRPRDNFGAASANVKKSVGLDIFSGHGQKGQSPFGTAGQIPPISQHGPQIFSKRGVLPQSLTAGRHWLGTVAVSQGTPDAYLIQKRFLPRGLKQVE
jgi:hypothetical protein